MRRCGAALAGAVAVAATTLGCGRASPAQPHASVSAASRAHPASSSSASAPAAPELDAAPIEGTPPELVTRPEWTVATTMRAPPYKVPTGVANVVAHVPDRFDDAQKIHLVLFFHGAVQCAAQLGLLGEVTCKPGDKVLGGYGYDARHDDAATNSLFAIPQFAFFGGGSPGRMIDKGYFPSFVTELMAETFAPGLSSPKSLDDVEDITLIAHSAGFNPVIAILSRDELASKVKNVVLLDSFFAGGEDYYATWFKKQTPEHPRRFIAIYGDSGDSNGHHASMAKRLKAMPFSLSYLPSGSMIEAMSTHDATIGQLQVNHYWMPTMLLAKVVAGLGLPTRAVPVPQVIGAPPAARAMAFDSDMDEALEEGDVALSNGAWADDYAVSLASGEALTVTTTGGRSLTETCCTVDVETQVLLAGRVLARDDDGAGGFDSQLRFHAESAGAYVIRVTTSGSGDKRGPYRVRAVRR